MERCSFVTAALAFLAPIGMASAQTPFTQYAAPDGTFTILFPGTPSVSTPEAEYARDSTPFMNRNYVVSADAIYVVTTSDYAADMAHADLTRILSGIAQGCGGTYTIRNHDSYQRYSSVLALIECPPAPGRDRELLLDRVVASGNRIYQIAYSASPLDEHRSSAFLNSLHINSGSEEQQTASVPAAPGPGSGAGAAAPPTAFTPYSAPDGTFTVLFPGTPTADPPETSTLSDGTLLTSRRYSASSDAAYTVETEDYANSVEKTDLASPAAAAAKVCGGTVSVLNREPWQSHPAALFRLDCQPIVAIERVVANGKRLYQIVYTAYQLNPDRSSQFLNSLHIN